MTKTTMAQTTLDQEDALVRGRVLVEEIRALLKKSPKATRKDLGGPGSGNHGHVGRPGSVGGSASGERAADRASREADIDAVLAQAPNVGGRLAQSSFDIRTKPDGGELTIREGKLGAQQMGKAKAAVFPEHDLADVAAQVLAGIPGDLDVKFTSTSIAGRNNPRLSYVSPHNTVVMTAERDDGLAIVRSFTRNTDGTLDVTHDKFEIPEEEQGKGTAKQVLGDSYDLYKTLGVRRITTLANRDVGGYAWAKFGFKASDPEGLATDVLNRLTRTPNERYPNRRPTLPDLSPQERDTVVDFINDRKDDPTLPWHIAGLVTADGRKVGKELLKDTSWLGELDMRDKESVRRLTHYTKGKQKAKGK